MAELARELGGECAHEHASSGDGEISGIQPPALAARGDIAPVLRRALVDVARGAKARGAVLLVDAAVARWFVPSAIAKDSEQNDLDWTHAHAPWVMARLLERCAPPTDVAVGAGSVIHPTAVLHPGVTIGARVRIEAYAVVGGPGFGFAAGPDGSVQAIPHLGGVAIGDDVFIGAHTTVHAGVLAPTRIGRGTKLDAHVHIGHNCEIGEDCFFAAQSGLAGSVVVGSRVLLGGQVGVADHVSIGDRAQIAAKSGVIGDVPAGAVVAGYPARPRMEWLRSLAKLESLARKSARRQK